MNSYKNTGGSPPPCQAESKEARDKEEGRQGTANCLLTPCLTQGENPSCFPASLPPCFLLRGRLECASILLWTAFAEGGDGSSRKRQNQACLASIFLAGLAMGFQMTTGELEAQDRGQARSMAISRYGIVAAESPLAAQAGVAVLERGGTAADAAVAANAMMGLVAPMSNGIGGDLFALVYDAKTGKLYGLNASGWAPTGLNIELLKSKGFRAMPEHGIYSVTVPGAVDGWQKLLERFGRDRKSVV